MRPNGRIDAAARGVALQHQIMQRLAHPMQALEFETGRVCCHFDNGRHRMGVMGGKLRIDAIRQTKQLFGQTQIGHIGGGFSCIDRKARQPFNLRQFHLGVPIGAFDQTQHDLAVKFGGKGVKPVNHRACAQAIALHHNTKPVPPCKAWISQDRLNHIKRQIKTICFFGINVKTHPALTRIKGQFQNARHKFGHHTIFLCHLISRMQRREFDRNSRVAADIPSVTPRGDLGNGGFVRGKKGIRIGHGHRGLAQHIIGIAVSLCLLLGGARHRVWHGLTQHELPPHLAHGARHGGADHRFAQTAQGPAQHAIHAFAVLQNAPRQHQRPSGCVYKRGGGFSQMLAPG